MNSSPAAVTTGISALRNAYLHGDVEAAEPAGPRERHVVHVELLEHRRAREAHGEAHAVQPEHERGQREVVEPVEHPLTRAEEREQARLEAEQVEGEQPEREDGRAHEEHADRRRARSRNRPRRTAARTPSGTPRVIAMTMPASIQRQRHRRAAT